MDNFIEEAAKKLERYADRYRHAKDDQKASEAMEAAARIRNAISPEEAHRMENNYYQGLPLDYVEPPPLVHDVSDAPKEQPKKSSSFFSFSDNS